MSNVLRALVDVSVFLFCGFVAGGLVFVYHYGSVLSYTCVPEDSAAVLVEEEDYREMPALNEFEKCFSTLRKTDE